MEQPTTSAAALALPMLELDNHAIWLYSVRSMAQEYGIERHLEEAVPIPDAGEERRAELRRRAQAGRLILGSVCKEILIELGDDITTKTPNRMLEAISQVLAPESTPEEHDRLLKKAQQQQIRKKEDVEDYLRRQNGYEQT